MDAAGIQAKVASGYAKAASKLGPQHAWYRPRGTGPVIVEANGLGQIAFIASATPAVDFSKPATETQNEWYALVDQAQTAVGDYFVGADGTWFMVEQGLLSAPVARQCNATLSGFRDEGDAAQVPATAPGSGFQGYVSGDVAYDADTSATETPLFAGWPGLLRAGGGHAEGARVTLPGNVKEAGYTAYLPPIPGVVLRESDRIRDDQGGDFLVSSAELSSRGWHLLLINVAT